MEKYKKKEVLEYIKMKLEAVIEDVKIKFSLGELRAMSFLLEQCLAQCGVSVHNVIIKIKRA